MKEGAEEPRSSACVVERAILLLQLPSPPPMPPRRMDFGSPDLLEVCLEPQDDVFSTGSFLDLGLHCPPPEAPVTRLQEQSLQGWESSGGHGCVSEERKRGWVETQL